MRIISTVPSQTELLHALGLDKEVVGITKFCVFPESWFTSKTKIGGTKNLNIEKIQSLQPDWIFSNKEENIKEQIEQLYPNAQHYTSDVHDLPTAIDMITTIGYITQKCKEAQNLVANILENFSAMRQIISERKALYLIWKNPYMSIGQDTFIHDMLRKCGWINVCQDFNRYPSLNLDDIKSLNPDDILLSSEPYPFKEQDIEELKTQFPDKNIILVDGTYFSWYGSRLKYSPQYFNTLINQLLKT